MEPNCAYKPGLKALPSPSNAYRRIGSRRLFHAAPILNELQQRAPEIILIAAASNRN